MTQAASTATSPLLGDLDLPPAVYNAMMAEVARQVEALERAAVGSSSYKPRNNIKLAMDADDPELVLDGPAGTGKSRGCLEKLHRDMLRYPGARALIARKTRKSLSESALFTFERFVLRDGNPVLGSPGPTRQHRDSYTYPNGSQIIVGGLDNVERILGGEYDVIYVPQAEEITQDDRDVLNSRLRSGRMPYQQLLMDCNPSFPTHWIKRLADTKAIRMLATRHVDNPKLWNEKHQKWTTFGKAYMSRLERLSGVRYKRLVLGQWVKAEGVVYEGWDRLYHVVPNAPVPKSWPRYLAIDFGFNNPFVCQWWARNPDGRLVMYRELYVTQRLVEDCCRDIIAHSGDERFVKVITDHDAEDRKTVEKYLKVRTTAARKPIMRGIQAVASRLKLDATGNPRLTVMDGSLIEQDPALVEAHLPTSTLEEVEGYVWKRGQDGKILKKEEPVDADNHGMDTMRYMVAEFDLKPVSQRSGEGSRSSSSHTNF